MKNWAKSLLYRMGFVKRRGNTKVKVPVEHFEALKSQFLFDIQATVEMQEIPPELIINWDQTGIKIVSLSSWTIKQKGAKWVEISGVDDKRQITAVFAATPVGEFLPFQLIYISRQDTSMPSHIQVSKWYKVDCNPSSFGNYSTEFGHSYMLICELLSSGKNSPVIVCKNYPTTLHPHT